MAEGVLWTGSANTLSPARADLTNRVGIRPYVRWAPTRVLS